MRDTTILSWLLGASLIMGCSHFSLRHYAAWNPQRLHGLNIATDAPVPLWHLRFAREGDSVSVDNPRNSGQGSTSILYYRWRIEYGRLILFDAQDHVIEEFRLIDQDSMMYLTVEQRDGTIVRYSYTED
jgi:hypothetical protein